MNIDKKKKLKKINTQKKQKKKKIAKIIIALQNEFAQNWQSFFSFTFIPFFYKSLC